MSYDELATMEAWIACSAERREVIAKEVARTSGLPLERVAPFRRSDLPLASFWGLDGLMRFVLLPGGEVQLGLSDAEVSALEALTAPHRDEPGYEARWGALSQADHPFRRSRHACVAPLLFAQGSLGEFPPSDWRREIGDLFVGEGGDDVEALVSEWVGSSVVVHPHAAREVGVR